MVPGEEVEVHPLPHDPIHLEVAAHAKEDPHHMVAYQNADESLHHHP